MIATVVDGIVYCTRERCHHRLGSLDRDTRDGRPMWRPPSPKWHVVNGVFELGTRSRRTQYAEVVYLPVEVRCEACGNVQSVLRTSP